MDSQRPFIPLRHYRRRQLGFWSLPLLAVLAILLTLPWLPPTLASHLLIADAKAAVLTLIAGGLGYRAWRARSGSVRFFLTGLALAVACWALGWLIFSVELWYGRAIGIDLVEEALHGLCLLILVWTLDRLENRPPRGFAPLFVLAMFGYLVLLPAMVAPNEYDNWAPTFLFFLFLDSYVALRCYLLALRTASAPLARQLRTTAWAFSWALLINSLDWAFFADVFRPQPEDWWAALGLLAFLPLLKLASPGRWRESAKPLHCPVWARGLLHPLTPFLLLALFPLFIHLIGYGAGVLLEHSRTARDLYLVAWLLLIALLLVRHLVQQQTLMTSLRAGSPLVPVQERPAPMSPVPTAARSDPFLHKLDQVLASRFAELELDLSQLADAMAMSPRQLQRRLKAAADTSPADYLRRYRLQRAAELLADNNKVAWVAQAVGFAHHSHFGRCFKQQFGLTPGEYQQHSRALAAAQSQHSGSDGTGATSAIASTPLS